ncbi:hypothetical protein D6D15_01635 [Aureobasidium pullulans]|uniref:Uncharacterized protein n=2 Tax=Aureobasidium pullulans TaxID=5580 RepID=A0A4S9BN90_AURPU|nr:hypothetical protein D6D15_01635 [Aureobasidium pullulans]
MVVGQRKFAMRTYFWCADTTSSRSKMRQEINNSVGVSSHQVFPNELRDTMASIDDLRTVIHHLSNPKSVEGLDPEKIHHFMMTKLDQIEQFLSQVQGGPREQPKAVPPPCMDFLIYSGIDKVMQNTVKELIAFDGPEAPLVHEHIGDPAFGRYLEQFLISTKEMIARDPSLLDNFEVTVRKRFLDLLIKKIQKSMNYKLRTHFELL